MEEDKLIKYLMDGCSSWEELFEQERAKAKKLMKIYQEEEEKQNMDPYSKGLPYKEIADLYQKALESDDYPKAAAVDIVKGHIAGLLGYNDLSQPIIFNNYGTGFTRKFIKKVGTTLCSESELLQMTYEQLRERLYEYVGLECVSLDEWKELHERISSLTPEEMAREISAQITSQWNGYVAVPSNFGIFRLRNLVDGKGANEIKSVSKMK